MEQFLLTDDSYERLVLSRKIPETINLTTFSSPRSELVMYYNARLQQTYFQTLPVKDNANLAEQDTLFNSAVVTYHPLHTSYSRTSNRLVLSVARQTSFSGIQDTTIYAEVRIDALPEFISLSETQNMPFHFLQLDQNHVVKYSGLPDIFPLQSQFPVTGKKSGQAEGYLWYVNESNMGFTNVLLVSTDAYNQEITSWFSQMMVVLMISLVIILGVTIISNHWIYRPIQLFEQEMARAGTGQFDATHYNQGIAEFTRLFISFNLMKEQIYRLMQENERQGKQKHQLEIDMIYYKINPHFIMNSLNSVHWMAIMHECDDIDLFISKLTYILGYSLGKVDISTSLTTEIKMLKAYVSLMLMRYDFDFQLNVEPGDYLDTPVSRLLLQPIAENAIQHGLNEGGTLKVDVARLKNQNFIEIRFYNDGKTFDAEIIESILNARNVEPANYAHGLGLAYVKLALEATYGKQAQMTIQSQSGEGTTVTLYLPSDGGEQHV